MGTEAHGRFLKGLTPDRVIVLDTEAVLDHPVFHPADPIRNSHAMARNDRPTILGRLNVGPKVAIIPLFFILDVAVIMAYTVTTIQTQRSDADLIRICTRQRDLNQRHTKEVLLVSQGLAPRGAIARPGRSSFR